ncbi:MAG TPA: gliding motility-associated C-terminal domain-containing protein [Draconibacterium sp.]|nr:gliding motility-associated C-terminal domain-containing protein [Draconibacterium sp.]
MIVTLLAALSGAAQEDHVVFEGAEKNYFVKDHPGSEYSWKVWTGINPEAEADSNYYTLSTSSNSNEIRIRWNKAGNYYLDVIETDITGCTNRKVAVVTVLSKTRNVAFANRSSSVCYNPQPDGYKLLQFTENGGIELDASKFPVDVRVEINGSEFAFELNYNDQGITVPDSFMLAAPENDFQVEIRLLEAVDALGQHLEPLNESDVHLLTIFAKPNIQFVHSDDLAEQMTEGFYALEMTRGEASGAAYSWWVESISGTTTDLQALTEPTANILWDGPAGTYTLYAVATDGKGCSTDTIRKVIEIEDPGLEPIIVYAGPDTIIGSCNPYYFANVSPIFDTLSYRWEPTRYLSDPTTANPVFTPGETTTYVLTASSSKGAIASDTVTISVSEIAAEAGANFMLDDETTALLNGTGSKGEQIEFNWWTQDGTFVGGQNTATPEISSAGTYYLQVADIFGCSATDSVVVSRFISAPIVRDDYDTTEYQQSVLIELLANDEDSHGDLDQSSLQIQQFPANGVVDNNGDGTVTYTPNNGFLGGDVFEYSVCNYDQLCGSAHVYVYVMAVDFFIPEAFTPNGDNINDYFEIKGIEMFERNSITIINRWGKTVYKAQKYGIATTPKFWDGKSNQGGGNSDLPTGTYFYVLDLGSGEQAIAGSVYIDR